MKKILLLLIAIYLFAGTLKIVNVPQNSDIYIDGKKIQNIGDKNFFKVILTNGDYDIKIVNKNFLDIVIEDVKISDKPTIITLNEETKDGVKYPVIPIKKYYKTIAIHYSEVTSRKVYNYDDYCSRFNCNVSENSGLFSNDVKIEQKYKKNLYVFTNNTDAKNTYIKVHGPNSYSSSVTTDTFKNEHIDLYPVAKFSFITFGIGLCVSQNDVTLTNENDSSDEKVMKKNYYSGWMFEVGYKHSLPIDVYWAARLQYYAFSGDNYKYATTDDMNGYKIGLGLGYLFKWSIPVYIEGGVMKKSLKYTYKESTYSDKYTYTDSGMDSYISLKINFLELFMSPTTAGVEFVGSF